MSVDVTFVICRFVRDVSAMSLWGAFAYLAALVPPNLADEIDGMLAPFRTGLSLLVLTMTAASLPLLAGVIGEGWSDVVDLKIMHDVAWETGVGHVWGVQAFVATLLLLALLVPQARYRRWAVVAASGLYLVALALGGHAAMNSGMIGICHRLNQAMHLLSAGAWLGALLPLAIILAPSRFSGRRRAMRVMALWRFSRAGRIAVVVVLLTGIANTAFVVGQRPVNWSSTYLLLLTLKISLALAMTALAVVNRYVNIPRLSTNSPRALNSIRSNSIIEIGLGYTIVGLVAVFGTLDPSEE